MRASAEVHILRAAVNSLQAIYDMLDPVDVGNSSVRYLLAESIQLLDLQLKLKEQTSEAQCSSKRQ